MASQIVYFPTTVIPMSEVGGASYTKPYTNIKMLAVFWNDMNEPAVFKVDSATFPDQVVHHYEGMRADHKRIHNVYGLLMSRATFEGLKTLKPNKRPFCINQSNFQWWPALCLRLDRR